MTIFATRLSLVLGTWRLRIAVEIDEPCDRPLQPTNENGRFSDREPGG